MDVEDPQTGETHKEWEVDWNEFYGSKFNINTDDVRENPEDYIDFRLEQITEAEQRIRDIENALAELGEIIGG